MGKLFAHFAALFGDLINIGKWSVAVKDRNACAGGIAAFGSQRFKIGVEYRRDGVSVADNGYFIAAAYDFAVKIAVLMLIFRIIKLGQFSFYSFYGLFNKVAVRFFGKLSESDPR